jgi:hypothetical protein
MASVENGGMTPRLPDSLLPQTAWQARLGLGFERCGTDAILARREYPGPLRIQKALYPEGSELCHAIVLHPPAGICGGDKNPRKGGPGIKVGPADHHQNRPRAHGR